VDSFASMLLKTRHVVCFLVHQPDHAFIRLRHEQIHIEPVHPSGNDPSSSSVVWDKERGRGRHAQRWGWSRWSWVAWGSTRSMDSRSPSPTQAVMDSFASMLSKTRHVVRFPLHQPDHTFIRLRREQIRTKPVQPGGNDPSPSLAVWDREHRRRRHACRRGRSRRSWVARGGGGH
jgi:hypothetical protein